MMRAALLGLLVALAAVAADWPRFRGPNGSGTSDDAVPVKWAKSNTLWRVKLPGVGNGSPVVVGGKVFAQSATPSGDARHLACLDAVSGNVVWTKTLGGEAAAVHAKSSLASSTPAADAERVYAVFWDGTNQTLTAWGHDGAPRWQQPLGPFSGEHGPGMSPVVYDNVVYVNHDQDDAAHLRAFDAAEGKPLWSVPRKSFRTSYSTPVVSGQGGDAKLIVASTAGISAYEPKTGKVAWEWEWKFLKKPLRMVSSPVLGDGMVYATTGEGGGSSHLAAVKDGGTLVWEKTRGLPYVPCMLLRGDYLYTVTDRGIAGCYEAKTGKEVFNERLGGGFSASPVLAGGHVFAANEEGTVFVFKAAPKFELVARNDVGARVFATPAVANGRMYLRAGAEVICVGAAR